MRGLRGGITTALSKRGRHLQDRPDSAVDTDFALHVLHLPEKRRRRHQCLALSNTPRQSGEGMPQEIQHTWLK